MVCSNILFINGIVMDEVRTCILTCLVRIGSFIEAGADVLEGEGVKSVPGEATLLALIF
ncbi:MAG: hypothetical protein HC845_14405 [Akkermansiaceae bacterium]|nr:hypothetical protein [Akkermansiaceae bacterium]